MRNPGSLAFLALLPCVLATNVAASTLTGMVVFGDSLSDTGNTTQNITMFAGGEAGPLPQTEKAYAPFYDNGRFTNGPNTSPASNVKGVWVEQLAPKLGMPVPTYALSGGTNFAFAGATTGTGTGFSGLVANIGTQLGMFCGGPCTSVSSHNLYVVWGGADDILNAAMGGQNPITAAHTAAANLMNYIGSLAAAGGTDFLWANLPPLGAIPEVLAAGPAASAFANAAAVAFNSDWAADIGVLDSSHPGIHVTGLDTFGLFAAIQSNPASFGFGDIHDPAANFLNGNANVNPDQFLFWDLQHPTTRGHELLADAAAAAVPEPATMALAGLGIAAVLLARRRRALR